MTIQEAIEIMEEVRDIDDSMYQYNRDYLESLDIVIEQTKKQIPMKPVLNFKPSKFDKLFGIKENTYTCRNCGNVCLTRMANSRNENFYCWHCGQAIDWKGEEDGQEDNDEDAVTADGAAD